MTRRTRPTPPAGAIWPVPTVGVGQHADLLRLEWLIREGEANGSPAEAVAARAPFDRDTALTAVHRGYQQIR